MKILIVGDVHWSEYSSIVRQPGKKYSLRLENLIESINWVESQATQLGVDKIIYLGDFFDRYTISDKEVTALREVVWSPVTEHVVIVGNHESSINGLYFNCTSVLTPLGFRVISSYESETCADSKVQIHYLPYIIEDDRKPLAEYLDTCYPDYAQILVSHNDIKDFRMGAFLSTTGFSIDEIESNCDVCFNGHLHNCGKVSDKIVNVGNITGQNFSEDALRYEHHVALLDTDTYNVTYIENPYALNFYKLDFTGEHDMQYLDELKTNAVVSITCYDKDKEAVSEALAQHTDKIITQRITTVRDAEKTVEIDLSDFKVDDHLKKFTECCLENIENTDILSQELNEVCR